MTSADTLLRLATLNTAYAACIDVTADDRPFNVDEVRSCRGRAGWIENREVSGRGAGEAMRGAG